MAMTELLLVWLGSVAVLASYGLFYTFADRWSGLVVELAATVLWSVFAIAAMDVIVPSGASTPVSEPVMLFTYLGIAFALITFSYFLYDLLAGIGSEAENVDLENIG